MLTRKLYFPKNISALHNLFSISDGTTPLLHKFAQERTLVNPASFPPPKELPNRRVVVTGMGLVTPLATGVDATWKRLCNRETGLRSLTAEDLVSNAIDLPTAEELLKQLPAKVIASVDKDAFKQSGSEASQTVAPFVDYVLNATTQALKDANWLPESTEDRLRTGVSIGSGIGSMQDVLDASDLIVNKKIRRLSPFFIPRILINMASGNVSIKFGLLGPNHATVTACASSAHAIGDAYRMVKHADADVIVAGGTEACIDALSISSFSRLRALSTKFNDSPTKASRPFDRDRDGFVMGEGAGVVVLEELSHAQKRGAKIYAEVRGYGMSGDGYHITSPAQDGRGAYRAMQQAVEQSNFKLEDVDYINTHGTSTPMGDVIEASAIKRLFDEHATSGNLAFSSTKGAVGHMLGAAGAAEAVFTILAIHNNIVPPTINLENPDELFSDKFMPVTTPEAKQINVAMSNSFGFGGTNASLVFSKPPV